MSSYLSTSDIDPNVSQMYERIQIEHGKSVRCYGKYATQKSAQPGKGTIVTFRRGATPPVMTTPLAATGETPDSWTPSLARPTARIYEYGGWVPLTTWLNLVGPDPYIADIAEAHGEQQGLTFDTLDRAYLTAGSAVRYAANAAARASVASVMTIADIKAIIKYLEGNDAKKLAEMVVGGEKINTYPIPPAYRAITHTDCRGDWEALEGFIKVEQYASQAGVAESEIGSISGIRVETTTNAKVWTDGGYTLGSTGLVSTSGSNIDVYCTVIMAKSCYGTISLTKGNSMSIVHKPIDPLEQRMTCGWKAVHGGCRTNEEFMIRLEHGATDW